MPMAIADDGVALYCEVTGEGRTLLFIHEFAGDHRSWEAQVRHFSRRYQCVTYAARGYPPSSVPDDPSSYSQNRAVLDAIAVLDAVGADKAHVVGNSMGGFTALHLALQFPQRLLSSVAGGCGYGAHPDKEAGFRAECDRLADAFEQEGAASVASWYGTGPARVQLEVKDPRGHAEHVQLLAEHDAVGSSLTMRGVQRERPSLYALQEQLAAVTVPMLIVAGDEDDGVLDTDLMLKRSMPSAALTVLPRTGHLTHLEEPALFNALVESFLASVDSGRWKPRDVRSMSTSITGAK